MNKHLPKEEDQDQSLESLIAAGSKLAGRNLAGASGIGVDLRGANLRDTDFRRAVLLNARLDGADLTRSNLSGANLDGATFRGAMLDQTSLRAAHAAGIDLSGSSIINSDLGASYMVRADLSRSTIKTSVLDHANLSDSTINNTRIQNSSCHQVKFTRARIINSRFSRTRAREANFEFAHVHRSQFDAVDLARAQFGGTSLTTVDLSTTYNLHSVTHRGPSSIGVDTLFLSPAIPASFLRSAGLDPLFVQYLPSFTGGPALMYNSVFISYSSVDHQFAQKLHDRLVDKGVRCWLDVHQIFPGDSIDREIDRGIRLTDKVLLVCSRNSLGDTTSWWVDREVTRAIRREQQAQKETGLPTTVLIPLDIDGYIHTTACEHFRKDDILTRRILSFASWKDNPGEFADGLKILLRTLRKGGPLKPI